jgi:hypothetical protein
MRSSDQIHEVSGALAKAQAEFPAIPKTKTAKVRMKSGGEYSFDYADLPGIIEAIRPILAANSLAISQAVDTIDGKPMLESRVLHASGQWLGSLWALGIGGTPQERGSELTYARRYALCGLLGIAADEDDDGNAAGGNRAEIGSRQPRPLQANSSQAAQPTADLSDDHAFKVAVMNALIRRKFTDGEAQKRIVEGAIAKAGFTKLVEIPAERRKPFITAIDAGTFDNFGKAEQPKEPAEKADTGQEPAPLPTNPQAFASEVYAAIQSRTKCNRSSAIEAARAIAKHIGKRDVREVYAAGEGETFLAQLSEGKFDEFMPAKKEGAAA